MKVDTVASGALLMVLSLWACDPTASRAGGFRVSIPAHAPRFSLANGLEVILADDHRTPFVALNLREPSATAATEGVLGDHPATQ